MTAWGLVRQLIWRVETILALSGGAQAVQAAEFSLVAGVPTNFGDLSGPREVVVDVYFGGQPLGEARAVIRPGFLRFRDPAAAAALLAPHGDPARIEQALQAELPSNAGRGCTRMASTDCGHLEPQSIGIILDEDRFRVDFFLAPDLATAA